MEDFRWSKSKEFFRRWGSNFNIRSITIKKSDEVELFGISFDEALILKKHIQDLCRTANYKLVALKAMRKYLSLKKAEALGNTIIDSQFDSQFGCSSKRKFTWKHIKFIIKPLKLSISLMLLMKTFLSWVIVLLFIKDNCAFYLRKYIKVLLMQTPNLCDLF